MTIKPSKLVICPRSTTLFGWEYMDQQWRPSAHKLNPLVSAECPVTVKQLRSWLGAAKQLSAGLENYATVFRSLEQLVAGKGSAERLVWSDENRAGFKKAKDLVASVKGRK